jgi:Tfp pilus assembly protein FimT
MYFYSKKNTAVSAHTYADICAFSLVELLVSISIIVVVLSVVMVRQSAFNGSVLLRNQAYEIAFSLRQAQLLAVSGINAGATTARQQYGLNLNKNIGSNQTYQVFQDKDADGQMDVGDAYGQIGRIDRRFVIRDVTNASGTSLMGLSGIQNVYFLRPNFDAIFENGNSVVYNAGPIYIVISRVDSTGTDNGSIRCVEVTSPGQIQVVNCP